MFIPALSKYTLAGLLLGIFFLPADVRADSSTAVPSQEREAVKGGLHDQVDKGLPIIGGSLSLGLALITETALYRGVDDKVWLQPVFIYDNGAFHLQAYEGVNTAYDFYDRDRLKFSLFGELATEGFDAGDSPALAGMSEPDMVASLGFTGSFQTDFSCYHRSRQGAR